MDSELNALGQPVGRLVENWRTPPRPSRVPLQGVCCRLEPLDAAHHAEDLFEAFTQSADGSIWTYMGYGPFDSLDSYRAWIQEHCVGDDPLFFAILDTRTGKSVGVAAYLRVDPGAGSIEVGHLVYSPILQRTRMATEAMFLLMRNAFHLGYRRYEWKCNALNQASREAAQRLGFTFEGIFRQALVVKGRNRDTAWYSIVDKEWQALEQAFNRWLDNHNFDLQGRQKQRLAELIREERNH